jgi:DNA primase
MFSLPSPTILGWEFQRIPPTLKPGSENHLMREDLQQLKQHLPLLDYLRRHLWVARPVGSRNEFVGLCPLHGETHASFYVNAAKDLFYCHGCGRGGDLIRFVQLSLNLSFHGALTHLTQELGMPEPAEDDVLQEAAEFYQRQLERHDEALGYLRSRGLFDPKLINELGIGYAPGGILRRHLMQLGYSSEILQNAGLIDRRGYDTFYRRIVFPCFDRSRPINLYGRSIGGATPHRFLPRPKGGLFSWSTIGTSTEVILVEGLFDLAVLWQAGFINTTCAFGTHLTQAQFLQLSDRTGRKVFIAFDSDPNGAGQQAALALAQRLQHAEVPTYIIELPGGHDPNSFFGAGATTSDFARCLQQARSVRP